MDGCIPERRVVPSRELTCQSTSLLMGLDVGSTTVKAVVMDPPCRTILWQAYQRHETRQAEKLLDLLKAAEARFPDSRFRVFITGSGGRALAEPIGAKFVQEVNAVSLAVERLHPEAGSVIELGGQDAKIIIWVDDPKTGQRRKLPSMNDKCAGGTGAVIDKIAAKLQLDPEAVSALRFADCRLYPVAGKCGVFAETDINGLQKQGVLAPDLMASLFEALIQQNLSVLTRGNTLRPVVLLLGGPHTFIPALVEAWRRAISRMWAERGFALPEAAAPESLIRVPDNAQYFAALGAVFYGREEEPSVGAYQGTSALEAFLDEARRRLRFGGVGPGLSADPKELDHFRQTYRQPAFRSAVQGSGTTMEAYLGLDGGSTSTKAVLLDRDGHLLARAYQLSKGNPLRDTQEILADLNRQVGGARLRILGMGVTGYAKDMLADALRADVALVETVAHTRSALHVHRDVDVIVDVGGQDIKVIFLKQGKVRDFRLNTQCSAGNGYFLQATAQRFGYPVERYAEAAFQAERAPVFSYGCAVFLESDIVTFQQQGWSPQEIMAGLTKVLPKNIWLYVVQEPNLARFGRTFMLQGGTQHNLAAVKAQADFIRARVPEARIMVHPHTGESGAMGVALEAMRVAGESPSRFIGMEAAERLVFTTRQDESTRCNFCKNKCLRTFVDTRLEGGEARSFVVATCEKGAAEDAGAVKQINARLNKLKNANPNLAQTAAQDAFRSTRRGREQPSHAGKRQAVRFMRNRSAYDRSTVRVGIPRVLNLYATAPFFIGYLEALGVPYRNLVCSDFTDEALYREGSRRGSIDACYPSKVALSHVHQLLYKKRVDLIFFPMLMSLPSNLANTMASATCPTVAASPEVVEAAFTKEGDAFREKGVRYVDPVLRMAEPGLFSREMLGCWRPLLGPSRAEHEAAMAAGYAALERFGRSLRTRARQMLDNVEREGRVGVALLGRPYHSDPGLNHGIVEEIQKLGYPIFTVTTLPADADFLDRLFGEEVRRGEITHPMDITDVWKNAYSENTNRKVWAAKVVARHPNLVAMDLSNFRCGHDSPIYNVVDEILEASGTPYFTFHDIDENRPAGAIKIRVETIHYFLQRYEEELRQRMRKEAELAERVRAYRLALERQGAPHALEPVAK